MVRTTTAAAVTTSARELGRTAFNARALTSAARRDPLAAPRPRAVRRHGRAPIVSATPPRTSRGGGGGSDRHLDQQQPARPDDHNGGVRAAPKRPTPRPPSTELRPRRTATRPAAAGGQPPMGQGWRSAGRSCSPTTATPPPDRSPPCLDGDEGAAEGKRPQASGACSETNDMGCLPRRSKTPRHARWQRDAAAPQHRSPRPA